MHDFSTEPAWHLYSSPTLNKPAFLELIIAEYMTGKTTEAPHEEKVSHAGKGPRDITGVLRDAADAIFGLKSLSSSTASNQPKRTQDKQHGRRRLRNS